jgi:hypothetical protein
MWGFPRNQENRFHLIAVKFLKISSNMKCDGGSIHRLDVGRQHCSVPQIQPYREPKLPTRNSRCRLLEFIGQDYGGAGPKPFIGSSVSTLSRKIAADIFRTLPEYERALYLAGVGNEILAFLEA